jgi:GNAT superfamily N-acetyltransferase
MDIKPATPADISKIAALWHVGWMQGHADIAPPALTALRTESEFLSWTKAHLDQTHVAWIDGQVAGFFMIDGDELYQFYVADVFQGSAAASTLMAAAEKTLGAGLKWLACSVGNDRAARFYDKSGWAQMGITPYEVETAEGPRVVEVWRYEKLLG